MAVQYLVLNMIYLDEVSDFSVITLPFPLILASQSPRRREILTTAGFQFSVRVSGVAELRAAAESPDAYVRRLAREKAEASARAGQAASTKTSGEPLSEIVLAADTVVVLGDQVLEKPRDTSHAGEMLAALSGREHTVITGFSILHPNGEVTASVSTWVTFTLLSEREIADYVASGEPMDKAGGYAIQGLASKFVSSIDGCFFNVVGLPISHVYRSLQELNARVT